MFVRYCEKQKIKLLDSPTTWLGRNIKERRKASVTEGIRRQCSAKSQTDKPKWIIAIAVTCECMFCNCLKKILPFVSVDFGGVEVVFIYLGRPISVPNDQALWWTLEYPIGRGPLN